MDARAGEAGTGGMREQEETIRLLSLPETFGVDRVETVETHASLVFLAGDRAVKLKRAVRYPYLDYSTRDRRREACEAELAINRGFAPDLYLGVEAVTRGADLRLRLGGVGTPEDWVVVMRRFASDTQFDRLADRGALTPGLMRELADTIAACHRMAEPREGDGGAAGIAQAIELAVEGMREAADTGLDPDAVAAWATRARAALEGQAALLEARRRAGKVRACHGDLHLRNICLLEGRPTPFDAIEFDPHLSSIDVLYDLAFLLMDLHGRGLDGLGNALFNRYLDQADEAGGLAALPLFLSLRAGIRAAVAGAARGAAPEQARGFGAEAVRYLGLAAALLEDGDPAGLVAIGGASGTGKSTLAYALAPLLGRAPGARVLRTDVLRKRAAGVPIESRLPAESYTEAAQAATYAALAAEARVCLDGGQAVIADAVFVPKGAAGIERVAREAGVAFQGLFLVADEAVLLRRVAARSGDASDATEAVVRAQMTAPSPPPPGWAVIEAGGDPAAVLEAARAGLGRLTPSPCGRGSG
ncbi:MAG TPA: AAA family ATPase [Acetobacteraceae bacterium]|nr:AAA family ATPase [Acetobacteraceae bacterium]